MTRQMTRQMIRKTLILTFCLIFLIPTYSSAQEPQKLPQQTLDKASYKVDLEKCNFIIDFPEKPEIESECSNQTCSHKLSYTKVFVGEATIIIDALCKTADKNDFERFSLDEMAATLKEQAKFRRVDQYKTSKSIIDQNNDDVPEAKYAVLTGGIDGELSYNVFMSQLWMSNESFLTVEGIIEGGSSDKVDRHFSRIMRSVRLKK